MPVTQSTTFGALAAKYNYSRKTLWSNITPSHMIDMIQLGWQPHLLLLPPAIVDYIEKVVLGREARKSVFPILRDLVPNKVESS